MTDRADPLTGDDEAPNPLDVNRLKDVQQLQRLMARGYDVEAFMKTDMGVYIRARANRELEEAQEALLEVNASDTAAITELQLKGRVAARLLTYFGDMVTEAEAAEQQHAQAYTESQTRQD